VRLWTEQEHIRLPERRTPEILVADCAPMMLEICAFGSRVEDLSWLDAPPTGHLQHARELLEELGALSSDGTITSHGRALLKHGVHPRVAHMLVEGQERGLNMNQALDVAALIGERDVIRGVRDADIQRRIDALNGVVDAHGDRGAIAAAQKRRDHLRVSKLAKSFAANTNDVGILLALAYPDRVARRKADGKFLLRNGRTAKLDAGDMLGRSEWLAISDLDGSGQEPRIAIASSIDQPSVMKIFESDFATRTEAGWSDRDGKIVARTVRMLGAIVIDTQQDTDANEEELASAFARVLAERGLQDLPWTQEAEAYRARIGFARFHGATELPDVGNESLSITVEQWLAPSLRQKRTLSDIKKLDLTLILREMLAYEQQRKVDTVAPALYKPPKGREVSINYTNPERPTIAVRLQFMFGVKRTPTVAQGNVPLTIELLSPADRPIQVTQDLAGFWSGSYAHVRKEMKGRYPKHNWPEHP